MNCHLFKLQKINMRKYQNMKLARMYEFNLVKKNLIWQNFATGIFSTDGWMSLKWSDERYSWNPADYEDMTSTPLPFSTSWAPEVILYNAAEEKFIYRF